MDRPYGRTEVQAGVLGARVVIWRRAIGCAPAERIAADKQAMLSLPPVAPATGWRASLRLPRDYYLRYDTNDYSASPAVIWATPAHRGGGRTCRFAAWPIR